jgi:hypothetical protein
MAMAFREAGCQVMALCPAQGHSMLKTRAIRRAYKYSGLHPIGSLRKAILHSSPDLIIPCDDVAVQHLHELYALSAESRTAIARLIESSLGAAEYFRYTTGRYELLAVARELGILVPDTARVQSLDDLTTIAARQPFPWVLKVDGTWGGHGVKIANDMAEAADAYRKLSAPLGLLQAVKRLVVNRDGYWIRPWFQSARPVVTVQSYVPGRPANSAVSVVRGRVLAGLGVEVLGALSATGASSVVRVVENRQMLDASERLASRLQLSGFHGFDFVIENRTGAAYLIEMNPRCTPLCPLQLGGGRDMVAALCKEVSGGATVQRPITTTQSQIAYFPQAWRWNPESELIRSSYHDVPWSESALVEDLMRLPWPDRSLLARLSNRLRKLTFEERVAHGVLFSQEPLSEERTDVEVMEPTARAS